jgi:hypothetical protein
MESIKVQIFFKNKDFENHLEEFLNKKWSSETIHILRDHKINEILSLEDDKFSFKQVIHSGLKLQLDGSVLGATYQSDYRNQFNLQDVSHVIDDIYFESDNYFATIRILKTPSGP